MRGPPNAYGPTREEGSFRTADTTVDVFTVQSGVVCSGTGSTVLAVPGLA